VTLVMLPSLGRNTVPELLKVSTRNIATSSSLYWSLNRPILSQQLHTLFSKTVPASTK